MAMNRAIETLMQGGNAQSPLLDLHYARVNMTRLWAEF
jgi:hypothetical protein